MALLSPQDRQTLVAHLAPVSKNVDLVLFTQTFGGSESGLVAKQILDEIASLNDKITVVEKNFVLDTEDKAKYRRRQGAGRSSSCPTASTRECGCTARRPAMNSSGSSKPIMVAGTGKIDLEPETMAWISGGRQADAHPGVFDTDLTALSEGGRPRTQDGGGQPAHHGGRDRGARSSWI